MPLLVHCSLSVPLCTHLSITGSSELKFCRLLTAEGNASMKRCQEHNGIWIRVHERQVTQTLTKSCLKATLSPASKD